MHLHLERRVARHTSLTGPCRCEEALLRRLAPPAQASLALLAAQHPGNTGSPELMGLQTSGIEFLPVPG